MCATYPSRMMRRYVAAVVAVFVVSVGSGFVVYQARTERGFVASCVFQGAPPVTGQLPTPDLLNANAEVAQESVRVAQQSDLYARVAAANGTTAGALAGETKVVPAIGSLYVVTVRDPNASRAVRLSNALCGAHVAQINAQRRADRDAQAASLQQQVARLESRAATLSAKPARTSGEDAELGATAAAIAGSRAQVATVLSAPVGGVSVVTASRGAGPYRSGSLTRNLIVGLVAAVLISFLVVLVGEVVEERRRSATRWSGSSPSVVARGDGLVPDGVELVGDDRAVEPSAHDRATGRTHRVAAAGVGEQFDDRVGERGGRFARE